MNRPSPIRRKLRAPSISVAAKVEMGGTAQSLRPAASRKGEDGYTMLIAIFFLALMVISLAVAMPQVIKSIQRDHDLEAYQRGKQYRRAVQLYYRKFHAYPPNVDALVNTNQVRYLRKKYADPITGKEDWKPVLYGQNKTPTAMGFFGQPLAGNASTIAGIGPSGGGGMAGLPGITSMGGGSTSAFGGSSTSSFGSTGTSGSIFSSSGSDTSGSGTSGSASSTTGAAGGSGGTSTSSGGSSSSGFGSSSDQSGQTFGGAGIIGFSPGTSKQSILVYKKKNHYNEWEFTYDPISDMQQMGGGNTGAIGQPAGSTTSPVGSSPFGSSGLSGSGSGSGSSGSGTFGSGSSGSGSSPTPP
jgi:type II secretory pathway pseudopilin PulG